MKTTTKAAAVAGMVAGQDGGEGQGVTTMIDLDLLDLAADALDQLVIDMRAEPTNISESTIAVSRVMAVGALKRAGMRSEARAVELATTYLEVVRVVVDLRAAMAAAEVA